MPRRDITFAKGHYYHAFNRGASRAPIFFRPENYAYCERLLAKNEPKYGVKVVSYCLMPNHYHLLLRQEEERPVSDFIAATFNAYVQAVNREQRRCGTLFEGRFKATWVDNEAYLVHLCRYIHANPLVAGLVHELDQWPFSNLAVWLGQDDSDLWDEAFVRLRFPRPVDYLAFLNNYIQDKGVMPAHWRYPLDRLALG